MPNEEILEQIQKQINSTESELVKTITDARTDLRRIVSEIHDGGVKDSTLKIGRSVGFVAPE